MVWLIKQYNDGQEIIEVTSRGYESDLTEKEIPRHKKASKMYGPYHGANMLSAHQSYDPINLPRQSTCITETTARTAV
jgi:hypothetical protein